MCIMTPAKDKSTELAKLHSMYSADLDTDLRLEGDPDFDCPMRMLASLLPCHCAAIFAHNEDMVRPAFVLGVLPPTAWGWGPDPRLDAGAVSNGLVIIEDTLKDPRWRQKAGDQGSQTLGFAEEVRLYLMFPLATASGDRIGFLYYCLANDGGLRSWRRSLWGSQPKQVLGTGLEIMIREMLQVVEHHFRKAFETWLKESQRSKLKQLAVLNSGPEALAIVNTEPPDWQIVHLNKAAMQLLGYVVESRGLPFSKVFKAPKANAGEEATSGFSLLDSEAFVVTSCHDEQQDFMILARPAREQPIGRTWWAAHGGTKKSRPPDSLNVMEICALRRRTSLANRPGDTLDMASQSLTSSGSDQAGSLEGTVSLGPDGLSYARVPIEGLEIGPLLGRGAYGKVYRGMHEGRPVAVKVIDSLQSVRWSDGQPLEALLPSSIEHPDIVRTYAQKIVPAEGQEEHQEGVSHVWLLMEFCDLGDLGAAITEGVFREGGRPGQAPPSADMPTNYAVVAKTALEVARGVLVLHDRDIVHGDMAAGNILLASAPEAPHGFRAKVGDFGLARQLLAVRSRVTTNSYGCINYLAPEVFTEGRLSKAADVYAIGVLMWEMVAHQRAWAGMLHAQVMYTVAILNKCLQVPEGCHPEVAALIQQCLNRDPACRPTARDLVGALQGLVSRCIEA